MQLKEDQRGAPNCRAWAGSPFAQVRGHHCLPQPFTACQDILEESGTLPALLLTDSLACPSGQE